jgi:Na+/phosphate symporter
MERVVDSLWARAATRILLPILGAISVFIGSQMWSDTHETNRAVNLLKENLIQMTGQWALLKQQLDQTALATQSQIDQVNKMTNDRFQAQGSRVQKVEDKVDYLQQHTSYFMPGGAPR